MYDETVAPHLDGYTGQVFFIHGWHFYSHLQRLPYYALVLWWSAQEVEKRRRPMAHKTNFVAKNYEYG